MKSLLRWIFSYLFRVRLVGFQPAFPPGPVIILPNHVSFLDAIFLYLYLPGRVRFVVNTQIAARLSWALRFFPCITVDPLNPYSLKTIVQAVKQGVPLVLFPEGRITRTGNLMKVYSGIGFIALKTQARLYPVIFTGPERSKLSRVRDKIPSRLFPAVQILLGQPQRLTVDPNKRFKEQKREMADQVLAMLQQTAFQARYRPGRDLFDLLWEAADKQGIESPAVGDITGAASYKKLLAGIYVLAEKLGPMLRPERNVGLLMPNSIGHVTALFSLFYLSRTPAILNFSSGLATLQDCAAVAGLRQIITSRQFAAKAGLEQTVQALQETGCHIIYLEDVRAAITWADKLRGLGCFFRRRKAASGSRNLILFTSGSESKPKGVVLTHDSIAANLAQIASVIDYTPRDRMLNALPMFHSFGLTAGTLLPLFSGMEVYLYPSPLHYKMVPELAYDKNVTILLGTPTFLAGYGKYAHPYDFYSLRYVIAGGEKLKDEIRTSWLEKFGLRIYEGYGTTEASPVLAINTPLFYRQGSVGRFLPGIEWQVEAVEGIESGGKLLVSGPNLMAGYLLSEKGFIPQQGWYDVGDVVTVDGAGYVTIQSRLKRFAKISGEMVSLNRVEEFAEACLPQGRHAVISLPDGKKGERMILYTTAREAQRSAIRAFLQQSGESTLYLPAEVKVVNSLPLLGSGKIDYVALRDKAVKEVSVHAH
ncbi:AMP-binding protein [Acetonema longum]|uniref:AMP-dependent synthetase and ligase n=1 Tax=Acetonema longum DSM 6540 TaxID=1009370 RepID=F7NFI3_9FIRM|nr:AMP-binding protein [Acetonema longum]EGO65182.1 AMP-dependent synthetase and ligase [Acetonema longum DSM 6540]